MDRFGPRVAKPQQYQIRLRMKLGNHQRPLTQLTLRVQEETYRLIAKLGMYHEVSHSGMVWHLLHEWLQEEEGYDGSRESILDLCESIALDAKLPLSTLLTRAVDEWAREMLR